MQQSTHTPQFQQGMQLATNPPANQSHQIWSIIVMPDRKLLPQRKKKIPWATTTQKEKEEEREEEQCDLSPEFKTKDRLKERNNRRNPK